MAGDMSSPSWRLAPKSEIHDYTGKFKSWFQSYGFPTQYGKEGQEGFSFLAHACPFWLFKKKLDLLDRRPLYSLWSARLAILRITLSYIPLQMNAMLSPAHSSKMCGG